MLATIIDLMLADAGTSAIEESLPKATMLEFVSINGINSNR